MTEKLKELRRVKEKQDAVHAQELQEAEEKFDNMKEVLLTENALLRQSSVTSVVVHCGPKQFILFRFTVFLFLKRLTISITRGIHPGNCVNSQRINLTYLILVVLRVYRPTVK